MATIRYWFGQYQRYGGRMLGFKSPILKFFIGVRPDVAADMRHMKNDPILLQTDSKKKSQIREIETTFYEIKLLNKSYT